MALFRSKKKDQLLKVKSYSINQAEVLGQGAFGIVYKGSDSKQNIIAAKRIDGNRHPRILNQDLDKLLELHHPNVMKILDIEKNGQIVWMMMPFCELGDLNNFYRERQASYAFKFSAMRQIAAGIEYLHSRDIVHRDIKPGNILVASAAPLQLHLADFDVSKCLGPEVETSLMTSNVGTLAFKAPEFFQRTSPGKIEYHRNVDIYAAGLTFLAIFQAEKGKKMLIPQIETPMDDSEHFTDSIGRLITERIKYKVPELDIVIFNGPGENLKWLISKMTRINPRERFPAAKVLDVIKMMSLRNYPIKKTKLTRQKITFPVMYVAGWMDARINDTLLVRVPIRGQYWIQVKNRLAFGHISQTQSVCSHEFVSLNKHPSYEDYALECCPDCKEIRAYNVKTERFSACKATKFIRMCDGPTGSLLAVDQSGVVHKLYFMNNPSQVLQFACTTVVSSAFVKRRIRGLCYVQWRGILLFTVEKEETDQTDEIIAVNLDQRTIIWRLFGSVDGHVIKPECMVCDYEGVAYVSFRGTNRILQIDGRRGEVMSILLLKEQGRDVSSIIWSHMEPNLTLVCGNQISSYFVPNNGLLNTRL